MELFLRAGVAATQIVAIVRVAMPDWGDICVLQGLTKRVDHLLRFSGPLDDQRSSFLFA